MAIDICYTLADNHLYQRKAKYCFKVIIVDSSDFDSESLIEDNT